MDKTLDNYETKYKELELILESLQSGELSLDEAVDQYKRSQKLIEELEQHLKTARNRITKIKDSLK